MRTSRVRYGAAVVLVGAGVFVACTVEDLNPQPLPPGTGSSTSGGSSGNDANYGAADAGGTVNVPVGMLDSGIEGDRDAASTMPDGGTVVPDAGDGDDAGADAGDGGTIN